MTSGRDFWQHIHAVAAENEHRRNMQGLTTAKCTADRCDGGITERGYTDYDGYGSIWRDPVRCRVCGGHGFVEVQCDVELTIAAVEKEMAKLRTRLRELKKARGKS